MHALCTHLKKCLANVIKYVSKHSCKKSTFLEKHIMSFILTSHINLAKFHLIFERNILSVDELRIYQVLLNFQLNLTA